MFQERRKAMVVFGTRPEAIKMAPVIKAFENNIDFDLITCVTGQHRQMLDQVLSIFDIQPDIDLDLMEPNQTLPSLTAKSIRKVSEVLEQHSPDIVLVQGDTTTAMVSGLAGFYNKIPVGHVEAGLRTDERYDPFPEEINRRLLSTLTSYHFAPTPKAVENLLSEGFNKSDIYMTGNTVIDALLTTAEKAEVPAFCKKLKLDKYILVTAHRRENFGQRILNICEGLKLIANQNKYLKIVYPVHFNPNINEPVKRILSGVENIHLIDPIEYKDFVFMMKHAHLILTDSGGVQEEAPSFGKPVLVMRETTERPEAVEAGVARLVGTNPENVSCEVQKLLDNRAMYREMAQAANPFGDGTASGQILKIISERI